jgi:hypothetical protein
MALTPDEFTLLDDHKPQKIARFREVDGHAFSADLHVIVALYAVNDGGSAIGHIAIGHMRRDLGKFLSQGSGPLEYPTLASSWQSTGVLTFAVPRRRPHLPDGARKTLVILTSNPHRRILNQTFSVFDR